MLQKTTYPVAGGETYGGQGLPGNKTINPNGTFAFPEIVEMEYIPGDRNQQDLKCLAWRITWPQYSAEYNQALIPTMFSIENGLLNSFNYLNNTSPVNTQNCTFSLYYNTRISETYGLFAELENLYLVSKNLEPIQFVPGDVELEDLMYWVQQYPRQFELQYPEDLPAYDIDYQAGDFIHFHLLNSFQYGGIRIVSMSPRIIEVYLAVPNYY